MSYITGPAHLPYRSDLVSAAAWRGGCTAGPGACRSLDSSRRERLCAPLIGFQHRAQGERADRTARGRAGILWNNTDARVLEKNKGREIAHRHNHRRRTHSAHAQLDQPALRLGEGRVERGGSGPSYSNACFST